MRSLFAISVIAFSGLICSDAIQTVIAEQPALDVPALDVPALDFVGDFVETLCVDCHNADDKTAGLNLESFDTEVASGHSPDWDLARFRVMLRA